MAETMIKKYLKGHGIDKRLIKFPTDTFQITEATRLIDTRIAKWKENWKPYNKLDEEVKEFDREWADKILDGVPFKCPMYQCGGLMVAKERKPPTDLRKVPKDEHYDYDGDEQSPDLICTNCRAVYQFNGFKAKNLNKHYVSPFKNGKN